MARQPSKLSIPAFALYGESVGASPDMLHVEAIQSRSRRHHWEIAAHTHRGLHQILWVASGPATVSLDGRYERCHGPVAIVIPPGAVHAFSFSPETVGLVLTLDPRGIAEDGSPATGDALDALFRTPRVLPFDNGADATRRFAALMRDLEAEFLAPDGAGSPVPLWLARAVLWRLAHQDLRQSSSGGRRGRALFTRFIVLVEAHHREHLTVVDYARALGLTPERLNRLTRGETGQSALDILHERLAREACRRLAYTAAPIAKLALELGFDDPAYFCRFFKRRMGQSPREFRRTRSGSGVGVPSAGP
jgi:AraC family transcriptional activator of pobA